MAANAGAMPFTGTFMSFVAAINRHDIDAIAGLMAPDHLFVDSLGNQVQGVDRMRSGWLAYFAMCPDYRITVGEILACGEMVLATGNAEGTIDDTPWRIPAAWQAKGHNGRMTEWRVFADNKPVYEILARRPR